MWTLPLNSQLVAPPAYDATHAYFALDGDQLLCYRLATGARDWIVTRRPLWEPVVGGELLFVVETQKLTAFRVADGTIAWQLPFADKLAVRPVWDNGWLVVATAEGAILAYRALDGFLVWRRDLPAPAHAAPALAADRLYVPAAHGEVVALRIDTGAPIWQRRLGGPPNDVLALEDRVYVGSEDNFFYCLDAKDGRIEWRWRTGADVIGLPVVDGDQVYFVSLDNVLRALSRKNGVQRWFRALPLRPSAGPLLVGSTIVITGIAPKLQGYNAKDGAPAGDLATDGELAAPPHRVDGSVVPRLVIVTRDIAKGATAQLAARRIEPEVQAVGPLPAAVPPSDLRGSAPAEGPPSAPSQNPTGALPSKNP